MHNEMIQLKVDVRPFIIIKDGLGVFLDAYGKAAIKTKADFEKAGELRQEIRKKLKQIEDERKEIVKPINEAKDIVQALAKTITDPLEKALDVINQGMITWTRAEEKRIEAQNQKKLEQALSQNKPVEEIKLKETTKAEGFVIRKSYRAEVVDFAKLPDEYKMPDMVKLNKIARSTSGAIKIEGVRFVEEDVPTGAIR